MIRRPIAARPGSRNIDAVRAPSPRPTALRRAALALAALVMIGAAAPAAAQAAPDSYKVGDKVEVRPEPARDVWEPGVITDFTYDTGLPIVRWPANERAFEAKDVRPLASPPPPRAPETAAQGQARKAQLVGMTNATPPDDGPVAAAPRR